MTTKPNPSQEGLTDLVVGGVMSIVNFGVKLFQHSKQRSLAEFTAVGHNRVIALVSDSLTQHPVTTDILKFSLNVYSGYILQSVALLNEVGNVKVKEVLSQVNTNRLADGEVLGAVGIGLTQGMKSSFEAESYGTYALESHFDYPKYRGVLKPSQQVVSSESFKYYRPGISKESHELNIMTDWGNNPHAQGKDSVAGVNNVSDTTLKEIASDGSKLAQGKILNVTIQNNGQSTVFPVVVAISPIICNSTMLTSIYTGKSARNSWLSRIRRVKSGELDAIRDGFLVDDIIKEKAKAKKDTNKYVQEIDNRRLKNTLAGAVSGNLSLATASGVAIITTDVARAIERKIEATIESPNGRETVFKGGALIMLVIVDLDYEVVRIYHRGQNLGIDMTFSQIKSAAKGDGPNIMEIMLAFSQGRAPTF